MDRGLIQVGGGTRSGLRRRRRGGRPTADRGGDAAHHHRLEQVKRMARERAEERMTGTLTLGMIAVIDAVYIVLAVAIDGVFAVAAVRLRLAQAQGLFQLPQSAKGLLFLGWDDHGGACEPDEDGGGEGGPRRGLDPAARIDGVGEIAGDLLRDARDGGLGVGGLAREVVGFAELTARLSGRLVFGRGVRRRCRTGRAAVAVAWHISPGSFRARHG